MSADRLSAAPDVDPLRGPFGVRVHAAASLRGTIDPPSSKNYTTRFLLAAALGEGDSVVRRPALDSEDSRALQRCLAALGARLERIERDGGVDLRVRGVGGRPSVPPALAAAGGRPGLDVGNAGTVLRLLLGIGALLPEVTYVTPYPDSLGKRPNGDLLEALAAIGVRAESVGGRLPITLRGGDAVRGGSLRRVSVSGATSSQYLSSLLFLAPLLDGGMEIAVAGDLKSKPAVRQTLEVLHAAGISVDADPGLTRFVVAGPQPYQAGTFTVPGDYPGSAAILAAAAIVPSDVTVRRLFRDNQGERAIVDVLAAMGADVDHDGRSVRVRGGRPLRAVEFDGDRATDAVLAMAAAACFAAGTSRFYNVANLRVKECDRITDYRGELNRAGAAVDEGPAELIVHGRPGGIRGGVAVDSHVDHRVVMGLSIAALRSDQPIVIRDAHHVGKSYPRFFEHLRSLGARCDVVDRVGPA